MEKFIVDIEKNNERLDKVLVSFLVDKSRAYITKLIDDENVLINGKVAKPSLKVKENDVITVNIPEVEPLKINAENIPLKIIYEDKHILIIDKPQGMVVHPCNGHHEGTLVNAILNHCDSLSGINGVARPGIVHRIDKDTSGLICVAKTDEAHHKLADQLADHTMNREYIALVRGVIKENKGTIDMPIGRSRNDRKKMAVNKENGKPAITHFEVIKRYANHTLIRCKLVTGRTHQIRVHMAEIGFPVEGDPLYCGRHYDKLYKNGQLLTAVKLTLIHPESHKTITFETELPQYFIEILDKLD